MIMIVVAGEETGDIEVNMARRGAELKRKYNVFLSGQYPQNIQERERKC